MELINNHSLLVTIFISSLILSALCAEATDLSPSSSSAPSPAPVSSISSTPDASPALSPSPSLSPSSGGIDGDILPPIVESSVKKGAEAADAALDFMAKRIKDDSTSPIEAECLQQCVDNYSGVSDDFKKAQDAVSSGDLYMIGENLSAVCSEIDACQQCFSEMLGTDESPLAKFEESMKKAAVDGLTALQYTS
uniref:Putative pectinesterase 3 n=1 Tax=Davidia involucrata TaxID=16924 RepID=A0A5B7C2D6_DAVIN